MGQPHHWILLGNEKGHATDTHSTWGLSQGHGVDRKKPGLGRQVQRDSVCKTVLERQTYSAGKTDGRVFFPSLLTHRVSQDSVKVF